MKINQNRPTESQPPFNPIYAAYEPLFLQLLQQRLPTSLYGLPESYVPIPEVELRLCNFVKSEASELCLFVGPIGIGKSSVLRSLSATKWSTKETRHIYLDLNQKNASLRQIDSIASSISLPLEQRRLLVKDNIVSYIASEIESYLTGDFDFYTNTEDLFAFFWENNRDLLMPEALFPPKSREEKQALLQIVQTRKRVPFLFVCLKFFALEERIKNLVIIADNCDQKESCIIDSCIDTLCHLDRCFENISGSYDFLPRLTSIVSCRPATRWAIENGAANDSLGSHGYKVISISKPCSLPALLALRISANSELVSESAVNIATSNGITWEITRRELFLKRLCESLETNHGASIILALCNRNVADSLSALAEILSNRHFIDYDKIIGDVVSELLVDESKQEGGISRGEIMRALGYGNPEGDPIYPVKRTRIPNILSGDHCEFPKTFIKPRLIQALLRQYGCQTPFLKTSEICSQCKTYFSLSESDVKRILTQLHEQHLIESDRGSSPDNLSDGSEIAATERANHLWWDIGESELQLLFIRDDIHLSRLHQWLGIPTYKLDFRQRCLEMIQLIDDSIQGEFQELERIRTVGDYLEFCSFFGGEIVSDRLLLGVTKAINGFYCRYVNDIATIRSKLASTTEKLMEKRQQLERL